MTGTGITSPAIKGWCPGALRPMMSGDGLIIRLRPRIAELTAVQIDGLAELSLRHGNGFIQLTNRANLQIRGVNEPTLAALTDGLAALGLLDEDAEAEMQRNIVVNPFWSDTPENALLDTPAIANGLTARLALPDAKRLPGKFGFAVDTEARMRYLSKISADIRIETAGDDLIVRADGSDRGRKVATPAEAVSAAMELADWFVVSGGIGPDGRGRMRSHLAKGAVLPATLAGDTEPSPAAGPYRPGAYGGGVCVSFAFGQVSAGQLQWLARQIQKPARLTPWRSLFLQTPDFPGGMHLNDDLITSELDPMLRVTACTGAPGCPQAHAETRLLARKLASSVPRHSHLHVSGCAKGCAHPGAATVTLVADRTGFSVIRNGRASDLHMSVGLSPEMLVQNPVALFEACA